MSGGTFSDDLATVRAELNDIDVAKSAAALDSFSGEIYGVTPAIGLEAVRRFGGSVDARLAGERSGYRSSGSEVRGNGEHKTVIWMDAIGAFGDNDGSRKSSDYDYDMTGFAIGIDRQLGENVRIGMAAGYADTDLDLRRVGSHADIDSYNIGAYATFDAGRVFVDAQASYAHHDIDVTRRIVTGNHSSRNADGKTEADSWRVAVKAATALGDGPLSIHPNIGFAYVNVDQDGLRETRAADAGLVVAQSENETFVGSVGVDLGWTLGAVRPYANLALSHDFAQKGWSVSSRMIGGGSAFRIEGSRPGRDAGLLNLGIASTTGKVTLRVNYGLEVRERLTAHNVAGSISVRW